MFMNGNEYSLSLSLSIVDQNAMKEKKTARHHENDSEQVNNREKRKDKRY